MVWGVVWGVVCGVWCVVCGVWCVLLWRCLLRCDVVWRVVAWSGVRLNGVVWWCRTVW